jgi:hypothetical protein
MRKKQKHFSQSLFGLLGLFLIGIAFGGCEAERDQKILFLISSNNLQVLENHHLNYNELFMMINMMFGMTQIILLV